ncbi:helix-turn-helix transcriptional regulator [Metamycoplasma hyosynoviae]|uniref:helix-turn-helix transcriptional regulator n=1 Tax=Metamycoplasma hyosynoviae TaxID=29559 RepID=UPI0023583B7D|nr:helix-turn-helix transcriptional regulator [Metamycoplasma hyosynoviae]MDC8914709.1 helix-turn-helix transcriptional regulator [Metamycoplasma hyosynoviae]MDC8917347.1 helix-turn-helix transcriptional regulator [Metamycoplasma hyosynoviae]MDC8919336.1 helix-turn-helix transcriptional regulator [Metamycoplasma hyosynoviae]MDD7847777.1 helix-turn-helix transcriptional regulator [Metamycoplasma hyosynoviae]
MINYAKKIKEYRQKNFLTQEDFAKLLKVSTPCITRWENGKFEPTMKIKKKLYEYFKKANMEVEE